TGRVAHESRIAPRNRRSSSSYSSLMTTSSSGGSGRAAASTSSLLRSRVAHLLASRTYPPGSVVGDEHGDAAGGEVRHIGARGLALGCGPGGVHRLPGGEAELGDQVVRRLRAVEGLAVAVGEAGHAGDLLGQ